MRISISNLAWSVEHDPVIMKLLNRLEIEAIDVAPTKYFLDPLKATDPEVERVKEKWLECGIEIIGLQAILFGQQHLNLFGTRETQKELLVYLKHICRISHGLGAKRITFGAPKNRDRSHLSDAVALEMAIDFFRRLGDIADSLEVIICLEPCPVIYGSHFLTTHTETKAFIDILNHQAIKIQLDTGALMSNQEDIFHILKTSSNSIGHVHLSNPHLKPIGDSDRYVNVHDPLVTVSENNVANFLKALKHYLPHAIVSIEMLETKNEPSPVSIERAIRLVKNSYE